MMDVRSCPWDVLVELFRGHPTKYKTGKQYAQTPCTKMKEACFWCKPTTQISLQIFKRHTQISSISNGNVNQCFYRKTKLVKKCMRRIKFQVHGKTKPTFLKEGDFEIENSQISVLYNCVWHEVPEPSWVHKQVKFFCFDYKREQSFSVFFSWEKKRTHTKPMDLDFVNQTPFLCSPGGQQLGLFRIVSCEE